MAIAPLIAVLSSLSLGAVNPQEENTLLKDQGTQASRWDQYFPTPVAPTDSTNAHYLEIGNEQLHLILGDAKNRINPLFHISKDMMPSVSFWLKVYAKYSTYQTLIYDKDHPEIIYTVQDDRDLFRKGASPIIYELTSRKRLTKTLKSYKDALHQLQSNPKKKFALGSAGHRLIELWGHRSPHQWRDVEQSLRTQLGQRDRVMRGIQASERFMNGMEAIFKKAGMPTELTRIPLLESSFVIDAHSKCAAVGVWQFLEKSGREYLVIDKRNGIDERLSPIKSAEAAAKMIKRNVKILGDYALAIIAYNHGARNLIKLRKRYGLKNIGSLLSPGNKSSPLGYASRSYYAEFLAMLYADKYRDDIYALKYSSKGFDISIVKMQKPQSVFEIASGHNITLDELKIFNPDIFNLHRPLPKGTRIVIPRRVQRAIVRDQPTAPAQITDRADRRVSGTNLSMDRLTE